LLRRSSCSLPFAPTSVEADATRRKVKGLTGKLVARQSTKMDIDIRPCASAEEVKQAIAPIANYFGRSVPDADGAERMARLLPAQRVYVAWEGRRVVGGLGAFPFQLTVPGGRVPAAASCGQ
jgi:hypothetical protein